MVYKFGEIILVGFPHTDLQGISKRPAIILYDSGDQDVIVARITTQEYNTEADYKILDWTIIAGLTPCCSCPPEAGISTR